MRAMDRAPEISREWLHTKSVAVIHTHESCEHVVHVYTCSVHAAWRYIHAHPEVKSVYPASATTMNLARLRPIVRDRGLGPLNPCNSGPPRPHAGLFGGLGHLGRRLVQPRRPLWPTESEDVGTARNCTATNARCPCNGFGSPRSGEMTHEPSGPKRTGVGRPLRRTRVHVTKPSFLDARQSQTRLRSTPLSTTQAMAIFKLLSTCRLRKEPREA